MQMVVMERERVFPKGTRLIIIFDPKSLALPYRPLYDRLARVIEDYLSYPLSLGFANAVAASTGSPHIKAGKCTVEVLWVVEVGVYVNLIRTAHLPVELAYHRLYVPAPPVARRVPLHEATCALRRLGREYRRGQ